MKEHLVKKVQKYFDTRTVEKNGLLIDVLSKPPLGPNSINVGDNDYLCVSNAQPIVDAQIECLQAHSKEVVLSGLFVSDSLHSRTETELASFFGFESAVITQSGYAANTGITQICGGPNVNLYIDQYMHASIWDGIFFSKSKFHRFRHNDVEDLEDKIKKNGSGIIIVESLYSSIGDYSPLKEIVKIKEKYDCVLVLDESHTLGSYGEMGKGYAHSLGLTKYIDIMTSSLAKAYCCRAGIIMGESSLINYLRETTYNFIFSSSIMTYDIVRIKAAVNHVKTLEKERNYLQELSKIFFDACVKMGYVLASDTPSAVIGVVFNTEQKMVHMNRYLVKKDIHASTFLYPATPRDKPILRFTLNCGITKEQLNRMIKEMALYIAQSASHL